MEIEGKIITILPEATGQGKNGMWRSRDAVLETGGQYPKKVCFNLFGDFIDKWPIAIDNHVKVHFDIESREYNGRWFTGIKAWKVEVQGGQQVTAPMAAGTDIFTGNAAPAANAPAAGGNDLPF